MRWNRIDKEKRDKEKWRMEIIMNYEQSSDLPELAHD